MTATQPQHTTFEQWMERPTDEGQRFELIDGTLVAMSGTSRAHNLIVNGLYLALMKRIQPTCQVFTESVALQPHKSDNGLLPDVMMVCNEDRTKSPGQAVSEPILLAEVLSPTSLRHDRITKYNLYRDIPSLKHYLILSQETDHIWHWQPDQVRECTGEDAEVVIDGIGAIATFEIYQFALAEMGLL